MQALLGKIISMTERDGVPGGYEVKFRPVCLMPSRKALPEWLKDQTLTIDKSAPDSREIGRPGDSIVLTPAESAKWLSPLDVTPLTARGELPERIALRLRWWKEDKALDFTVRANGRIVSGQFEKQENEWTASVASSDLFSTAPRLPVEFEVTCDKMKRTVTVLPADGSFAHRLDEAEGEIQRMENGWYSVDILTRTAAGAICGFREKSRGVDHFAGLDDRISAFPERAGHVDAIQMPWNRLPQMDSLAMGSISSQCEGGIVRLTCEGVVDEGAGIRTSATYTLFDGAPLLSLERRYAFQAPKKPDNPRPDEPPKEPIDDLRSLMLQFKGAWRVERSPEAGSRIICFDGEALAIFRLARVGEWNQTWDWKMRRGWAIIEHPARREHTIYLFDPSAFPYFTAYMGQDHLSFAPTGYGRAVPQEGAIGYQLGISVGELCGAADEGGWVASRMPIPGGVRCGVVGRAVDGAPSTAEFTLGGETRSVNISPWPMSGAGGIFTATADFPGGRIDDSYDVVAAGIESRR